VIESDCEILVNALNNEAYDQSPNGVRSGPRCTNVSSFELFFCFF
jgi:hypothetical protein